LRAHAGVDAYIPVDHLGNAALLISGAGVLWWSENNYKLSIGSVVIITIDEFSSCHATVRLARYSGQDTTLLAEFRPAERAPWVGESVLRVPLTPAAHVPVLTPRRAGQWTARAPSYDVPLRAAGTSDRQIKLCGADIDLELDSALVAIGVSDLLGDVDRNATFSVYMPGSPEPRSPAEPSNLVYVTEQEFRKLSFVDFLMDESVFVRMKPEEGVRKGDVALFDVPRGGEDFSLFVCSPIERMPSLEERPGIILTPCRPWPPLALRHSVAWQQRCVQVLKVGRGEYDVWWRWAKGGARLCASAVVIGAAGDPTLDVDIPAIRQVDGVIEAWNGIPTDLRPTSVIIDGVLAKVDQGRFALLAALPPVASGSCEATFPGGASEVIPCEMWMDAENDKVWLRLGIDTLRVHRLVVEPIMSGRLRAEIWRELPQAVGGANRFGRLVTSSEGNTLAIVLPTGADAWAVLWETANGRSHFRGVVHLDSGSAELGLRVLGGRSLAMAEVMGRNSDPTAEI